MLGFLVISVEPHLVTFGFETECFLAGIRQISFDMDSMVFDRKVIVRYSDFNNMFTLVASLEDGYEKRLITGAVFVDLLQHGQPPTPPQQGARDDWRRTPDRPDTHHAGKQTLLPPA